MNMLVSKLEQKWIILTFRQSWNPSTAACKVNLSTLPPEPVIPSKKPFKVELVGGKCYSWCTCGHSKKQPFCDGAHKTKAQGLSPLRFVPEKDATVWLCGCKYTNNPPYCDGTHKQDFIKSAPLHEPGDS
uniref:CDGSH iron-sulfur domain-containing protein 3 n=1 Tax=Amphiprion clarkii TaxID=80970 RepID=A0AAT9JKB5_AMPCL